VVPHHVDRRALSRAEGIEDVMRALCRAWSRITGSVGRRKADRDFVAEIDAHLQLMADDYMRAGVPPEEAERRARIRFGGLESAKEHYRDRRGLPLVEVVRQDLRYAFRGLRRNPGFAAVAVLSLAIGIGANATIFSVVNAVLLQPLAYTDPQDIYAAREFTSLGISPMNPVHAREWARACPSLAHVALMRSGRVRLSTGGEPISLSSVDIAFNLFTLVGVEPIAGRTFRPDEEQPGSDGVVIISESLWRTRFNADPSLIGQTILVDEEPRQVVGIMPASLTVPYFKGVEVRVDVFRPLAFSPEELARVNGNFNYAALVRVKSGVSAEQALAEIDVVQTRFRRPQGLSVGLRGVLTPVHEFVTGNARLGLLMLAGAVGAVLLIVCVNLANLLLARIASRSRETAIRTALGASRARQFSQVLTESLVLSVCGGVCAVVLANVALQVLVGTTALNIPRIQEVRLDPAVLAFAIALTAAAGLLFGVLPAWRITRHDPQAALRAGSHTVTESGSGLRLRKILIGLEVGLSAALLVVAGLLTTSLTRLLRVDKGFDVDHILTLEVDLAGSRYAEPIRRGQFFDRLLARVNALPGVQTAGAITQLPALGQTWNDPIYLEHAPRDQWHAVDNRYASPGYFGAMNIGVLRGRFFDERDRGQGVAVLSEKAARLLWPDDPNPVGRTFMGEDDTLKTLVGIAAEVRAALHETPPPTAYYPYWQREPGGMALVVRTTNGPEPAVSLIRAAIREEDPQLAVPAIQTMQDVVDRSVAERRFQRTLMVAFAISALLVASLGIYGVVSYSVARRRNEVGIRMALGAQRSGLIGMMIREGMTPVVAGLAAGVALALALGRAIQGLLFDIQATDPLTIAGVMVTLLVVGALACFVPARRVVSEDGVTALRAE